jgi:hypothetical protein
VERQEQLKVRSRADRRQHEGLVALGEGAPPEGAGEPAIDRLAAAEACADAVAIARRAQSAHRITGQARAAAEVEILGDRAEPLRKAAQLPPQ